MDALFHTVAEFIGQHHAWAGPILGAIVLLESLVLVGLFVPATPLLVMAGGLLAAQVIDPAPVLFWCVAGAIVGDAVSYAFGRKLGPRALRFRAFRRHRRRIARTRLFARRHGAASIFVGRFFGPVRAFVPVIVGMLQMRARTFQLANAISAVVWVPAALAPGYLAAKGLAQIETLGDGDRLTLAIVAGAVLLIAGLMTWGLLRRRMSRREAALALASERSSA